MGFNIVITHGYSDSNKGDLAITQAIVDGLKNNFPLATITMLSTFRESDPDFWYHNRKMKENGIKIIEGILPTPYIGGETSVLINIIAALRLLKNSIQLQLSLKSMLLGKLFGGKQHIALSTLRDANLVVIKGGQFIFNDKEDLRGNLFMWRTLQPIKIAHKLRKKIIILGQSIGGFASKKSEKKAMNYLALCDQIVVREELSFNLLKKYGLNNIELKPDMAFNIDKIDVKDLSLSINNPSKKLLGITVVNWTFPESKNVESSKQSYLNNLVNAIERSSKELDLMPIFIPQVTVKHHGKSDLDLISILTEKLTDLEVDFRVVTEDYSASEMVSVYSNCKLLIGTRLHSCILAAVAGTPVIAIRYQGYKTQGVMAMLGMENFVHDINDLKADELFNNIKIINSDHVNFKLKIESKVIQLRKDINQLLISLKEKS